MAPVSSASGRARSAGTGCNGLIFWAAADSLLTPSLPAAVRDHAPHSARESLLTPSLPAAVRDHAPHSARAPSSVAKVKHAPIRLPPLSARRASTAASLDEEECHAHLPPQLPRTAKPASARVALNSSRPSHSNADGLDGVHPIACAHVESIQNFSEKPSTCAVGEPCALPVPPKLVLRRPSQPSSHSRRRRGRRCYDPAGAPCAASKRTEESQGMLRAPCSEADVFDPTLDRNAVVRGDVADGMAEKEALDQLFAQRRRSVVKTMSEQQRGRARRNSIRAKQESRESKSHAPNDLMEEASNHLGSQDVMEEAGISDNLGDDSNASGSKHGELRSMKRNCSILDSLKLKNPLEKRLGKLSVFCEKGRQLKRRHSRLQALLDERQKEFEKRPEEERRQLTEIFKKYDSDGSGALEADELVNCLAGLGLVAKTELELRELKRIGDEVALLGAVDFLQFSLELVPRARQRLQEMRHGHLYLEFKMYDEDDSGSLDEHECTHILERLHTSNLDAQGVKEMKVAFQESIRQVSDESGNISFEAFQELVALARHAHDRIVADRVQTICFNEGLSDTEAQLHPDELVTLCEAYRRSASAESEGAADRTWDEIRRVLIEYGLMPRIEEAQMQVFTAFSEIDKDSDGRISFAQALRLVRQLREERHERDEPDMLMMFQRFDRNQDGTLDMAELSVVLEELGVQPYSWEDQMEMRCLLDEVDIDGSGDLSFREFTTLVERLRERLAMAARRRQHLAACALQFQDHQVAELRDVFFNLDTEEAGFLSPEQLRQALDILRIPISCEDLRELIADVDAYNGDLVDFEGFLRFFRAVVPNNKN